MAQQEGVALAKYAYPALVADEIVDLAREHELLRLDLSNLAKRSDELNRLGEVDGPVVVSMNQQDGSRPGSDA